MWIFLALLSRLLWSGCNAVDQVLTRAHDSDRTRVILVLELIMDAPIALVVLLFFAGSGGYGAPFFGWIALSIAFLVVGLLPYYKGLEDDDAHNLIPYLEMSPVFVTVMAFIFKDERLTLAQLAGAGIVLLCGFLFSWDFSCGKFRLRPFALMTLSAFGYAASLFTLSLAEEIGGVWYATGWFLAGSALLGVFLLFGFTPHVRHVLLKTARATKGGTLAMALASNILSFLGLVSLLTAFTVSPTLGHAVGLSGAQPFFSFFLAALLGRLLPRHFGRMRLTREIKAKLFLILGIIAGAWLLATG